MNFPALKPLSRQIRRDRKHSRGSEGKGRLPRGIGIERLRDPGLNGAGSLSPSDLIRNSFSASPKSQITVPQKSELWVAIAVGLRAQSRLPGTEFLDAETKRQKSLLKCANAYRDQNPGTDWPEIPAETPYLVVCEQYVFRRAIDLASGRSRSG